jgi:broad specificity phosphatase PhoE
VARERCFGSLEGRPAEALGAAVAEARARGGLVDWGPPGGETGGQFRDRVRAFLQQLCGRAAGLVLGDVVLVTTHGGLIKELNSVLAEEHGCVMPGKPGTAGRICPNTGVSRYRLALDPSGGLASVQCSLLHDSSHLGDLQGPEPVLYGV